MVGGLACYGMLGFFLGPNLGGMIADQWEEGFSFLVGAALLGLGIWASSSLSPGLPKTVQVAPAQADRIGW